MTKMTRKQIVAQIAKFTTSRDALRQHAHDIAMMIFRHAAPADIADCSGTGDCTLAIELVRAMPGSWGTQMIAWYKKFTPIRINEASGRCEYDAKYKALVLEEMTAEQKAIGNVEKLTWWDVESANTIPFWEVVQETRSQDEYDWKKLLALVTRLSSTIERKIEKNEIKPEDVASAKAMSTKLAGLTFERVETPLPSADNDKIETLEPVETQAEGHTEGLSGLSVAA